MNVIQLLQNPIINEIVIIGFVICAVIFVFSKVRQQDLDILRNANTDLRDSIDDKSKQIETLQHNQSVIAAQIVGLQEKVNDLEKKNSDLEDLVKQALVMYFKEFPNIAKGFVAKV